MKNWFLYALLSCASPLVAADSVIFSNEFVEYHLKVALSEIENEDVFFLIQENVINLKNRDASNDSAKELLNLIEEGYKIDSFNMSKLIETLTYKDASKNATKVIIKALEHGSWVTSDHMFLLIQTLTHADASDNATAVILKALEYGAKFGLKERLQLAEVSKVMNAKKNVEKIREALHERANQQLE